MARELNRELFQSMAPKASEERDPRTPAYAKADEVRALHLACESLSRRMKDFESRVELLQTKVDTLVAQNKQRFERVQGHFQGQTEMVQNGFADIHSKIAQVISRVNERRLSEGVMKEMVDRHSQAAQTFEVRLQQMQKLISEQEMQLMNSRAELRDARQELARLKKL